MNDPEDVLRSLRRHAALMLGTPPWTVRLQRTRVSDDARPAAVVEEAGPLTTTFSRARMVNQGDVQRQQSYSIVCYPGPLLEDAADARQQAGEVRSLLNAGFSRGLVTGDTPPVLISAPWTFPVYDYDGIPVSGPNRAGPAQPYTYADVDDTFNVRPVQDSMDELRFTVVANLRVGGGAGGTIPPAAEIATELIPGFAPDGIIGDPTVTP